MTISNLRQMLGGHDNWCLSVHPDRIAVGECHVGERPEMMEVWPLPPGWTGTGTAVNIEDGWLYVTQAAGRFRARLDAALAWHATWEREVSDWVPASPSA